MITGFLVTLVLFIVIRALLGTGFTLDNSWFQFLFRWLHVLSGVMWIGLLWYFNFVQIPNMPNIPDDQKPAIGKVIAPAALWWFRWGAMATIVTGIILAGLKRLSARSHCDRAGRQRKQHADRHRHVARHDHVVQRLVRDLAEPEEGVGHGRSRRGREGRRRENRDAVFEDQHAAVDPHALLHGGGAERRLRLRA